MNLTLVYLLVERDALLRILAKARGVGVEMPLTTQALRRVTEEIRCINPCALPVRVDDLRDWAG